MIYKITTSKLNIRAKADINSDIIGAYVENQIVDILEKENTWGKTNKGWISMNYTKLLTYTRDLYNQNDFADILYPSASLPKATIKSGGCGLCCCANILRLFKVGIDLQELTQIFIDKKARVNGGTDMNKGGQLICDIGGLTMTTTNDEQVLWEHLKQGGYAIANVDGDVGAKGIFSNGGHYINIIGTEGDKLKIFDVGYYNGKFNSSYRSQYVTRTTDSLGNKIQLCTQATLNIDTANRNPQYYLFTQTPQQTPVKQPQQTEQVSDWAQSVFNKVTKSDDPLIKGNGKGNYGWQEPVTLERLMVILDKMGLIK